MTWDTPFIMCIGTVGINVVIFDAERENVLPYRHNRPYLYKLVCLLVIFIVDGGKLIAKLVPRKI